jgi:hypothetical protein
MIAPNKEQGVDAQFRRATQDDVPFVAWCNFEATSPSPDFCYWDPLLEGFEIATIDFLIAAIQHDALAWCRIEDFLIGEIAGQKVAGASGFVMDKDDYRPIRIAKLPDVQKALGWDAERMHIFLEPV